MGVSYIGRCDALCASGAVLRRAGVRVRGVRVLHVLAVRAGHVRVAGRARAAARRRMTARGPGAPAAAAPTLPTAATAHCPLRSVLSFNQILFLVLNEIQ